MKKIKEAHMHMVDYTLDTIDLRLMIRDEILRELGIIGVEGTSCAITFNSSEDGPTARVNFTVDYVERERQRKG